MITAIPTQRVILTGLLFLLTAFSANAAFFFCIDDDFGYHWDARAIRSTGGVWVIDGTVEVDGELWNITGQYRRSDYKFQVQAINPNPDDCYSMSSSFDYDGTLIHDEGDFSITFKWTNNCGGLGFATGIITPGCRGEVYDGPSGSGADESHTDPNRMANPFASDASVDIQVNAYPNPFTDQLSIAIQLAEQTTVNAQVFDLQGRVVKQFSPMEMTAGTQIITWDGTDNNSNALPSGFYVLHANGATQTLQLIAR